MKNRSSPLTFYSQTRRSYELRTTGARRNYHLIKHVQWPLQLLHHQLSVHSVQMGLVRTESQSPELFARSNLGEVPRSLTLQQLFPISSSSSLQGPGVSTYVLKSQVTSCLLVTRDLDAFRTCAEKNLQGFEMGWRHYELTQGSSLGFVSPCRYFLGGGRNLLWIWAMTT